ncbi:MAG: hypothetical protein CMP65_05675 [Flavobacteriales bacterium]|nr:hypothetical protein [Flavobacteriales bacterium]|tara:strand:+ start:682 stop:1020 length:339 start_codon:yes stop_codon:yes gene_type:complete
MEAHKANLINAITLILLGLWGFYDTQSNTALIPTFFGIAFLIFTSGIKEGNKIISHLAVLFTLIILIALVGMRLPKSLESGGLGLYRVILMIATSAFAMFAFIKSFIDARRK